MKIESNKNWTTCLRLNTGDGSPRVFLLNSHFLGSVPNRGVVFCAQKSNESRYFYRILIEIYKRTLFSKRKFVIILAKEAVTETVKLRYKYRKVSFEC